MVLAALAGLVALAATGCGYQASFADCQVRCTTSCPDGLVCSGGYCRPPGAVPSCDDVIGDAGPGDADPGGRAEVLRIRATPDRDLDLLFVVDDSATMSEKQVVVSAAIPAFLAELETLDGGLPNLHIGVVSSDMGTQGSAVATPGPAIGTIGNGGCAGNGKGGALLAGGALTSGVFLQDIDVAGTRERNYDGTLATAVGRMIAIGDQGCGFEQHLAAMRQALSPSTTANVGFLRARASLAVIVFADEDDCSVLDPAVLASDISVLGPQQSFRCFEYGVVCDPDNPRNVGAKNRCRPRASSPSIEDVAPFRSFLAGLKADPHDVLLGVVAGPLTSVAVELRAPTGNPIRIPAVAHSCAYTTAEGPADADPSIRFDALVQSFPGHARFESICQADLAPELTRMAQATKLLVGDACLERPIADRSDTPGVQADCIVEDVVGTTRSTIAACGSSATPCWELVEDAARCSAVDQHLKLVVTRTAAPPADARTVVRCVTP
jgi:hypothetical protein